MICHLPPHPQDRDRGSYQLRPPTSPCLLVMAQALWSCPELGFTWLQLSVPTHLVFIPLPSGATVAGLSGQRVGMRVWEVVVVAKGMALQALTS